MELINMNIQIGIIGPEQKNMRGTADYVQTMLDISKEIGAGIAKQKAILITGGCSGVVRAACEGAMEKGGIVIGTPGRDRGACVAPVTVEICTPIDVGDYLFAGVPSCDALIVLPGDAGTLAELAIAYRYKKPLVFIKGFDENLLKESFGSATDLYPYAIVNTAQEAVAKAMEYAKERTRMI